MTTTTNLNLNLNLTIAVVGDKQVGKTTFVYNFVRGDDFAQSYWPTIATDHHKAFFEWLPLDNVYRRTQRLLETGEMTTVEIVDTAGDKRFWPITKAYLPRADAFVVCVDSAQSSIGNWLDAIDEAKRAEPCIVVVVALKADKRSETETKKLQSNFKNATLPTNRNVLYFDVSAFEKDKHSHLTNVIEVILNEHRREEAIEGSALYLGLDGEIPIPTTHCLSCIGL